MSLALVTSRAFTVIDAPQRSNAWFQARLGRLTGSRTADAMSTLKSGGESAGRRNLRLALALERLTGKSQDAGFITPAMQAGIDREPEARRCYETLTGTLIQETGFLAHNELMLGVSLDGHAGDFAHLIEIKNPQPSAHYEVLKSDKVPGDYLKQITAALWLTGAETCDFFTYCPDFPERLQAKVITVRRTDVDLGAYEQAARTFLSEVDAEVKAMEGL